MFILGLKYILMCKILLGGFCLNVIVKIVLAYDIYKNNSWKILPIEFICTFTILKLKKKKGNSCFSNRLDKSRPYNPIPLDVRFINFSLI